MQSTVNQGCEKLEYFAFVKKIDTVVYDNITWENILNGGSIQGAR
jgi:hypothetical protein